MRRRGPSAPARARLAAITAVLVCAAAATGCVSSRPRAASSTTAPANTVPASGSATLSTSPARPTTRSTIAFRFRAPVTSGAHGENLIGYSLSVTGTGDPGCVGAHEAGGPAVAAGAVATIMLGPRQLGGPWCPSAYSARAVELQRPRCRAGVPCPQYVRVVAIVAEGRFTVADG